MAQAAAAIGALVFLSSGLLYHYAARSTVTKSDFWRIYHFCLNTTWLEGSLATFNGHSFFFPSFFWQADLRWFRGNQELLFYVGLALMCITLALFLVPIWRDTTVNVTAKLMASLVLVVGMFWMGRSSITISGPFSCTGAVPTVAIALALLYLPALQGDLRSRWSAMLIVCFAACVVSFSFGGGLAIWPTVIFLAWSLRLKWRVILIFAIAAVGAVIIFALLPTANPGAAQSKAAELFGVLGWNTFEQLFRLVGSPLFLAQSGWESKWSYRGATQGPWFQLFFGAGGVALAAVFLVSRFVRRDLGKSPLELVGVALIIFNLAVMGAIIAGRANMFVAWPNQLAAPRYIYWSALFWVGLFIAAIRRTETFQWLRWPLFAVIIALPILAFPSHYKRAIAARNSEARAISAATGLINGVRDAEYIKSLGRHPNQVYRVAPQFKARSLDMFADGLHDWIGMHANNLFAQHLKTRLRGLFRVESLVESDDGRPAARVTGWALEDSKLVPTTLVIVDAGGTVRGVARPSIIMRYFNLQNGFGESRRSGFLGYIRDYDAKERYTVRSVHRRALSEEQIIVRPTATAAAPSS